MPMDKSKYPPDWNAISRHIRERAGQQCEFCSAPNGAVIERNRKSRERWSLHSPDFPCGCSLCLGGWDGEDTYPVRVVLTVAHMNHEPMDCRDENLKALCQLCHLRYDARLHAANAAATRRAKVIAATGQGELL